MLRFVSFCRLSQPYAGVLHNPWPSLYSCRSFENFFAVSSQVSTSHANMAGSDTVTLVPQVAHITGSGSASFEPIKNEAQEHSCSYDEVHHMQVNQGELYVELPIFSPSTTTIHLKIFTLWSLNRRQKVTHIPF